MKKAFPIALLIITLICLVFDAHNRWKGDTWKATINADGYGYYAYLPAIFVLHSFDYEKIINQERSLRPEVSYEDAQTCFPDLNGKRVDKFLVGESILLFPVFIISYIVSLLFGFDANGYSLPFQIGVSLSALFYLLLGLVFFRKLLLEYKFSEYIIALTSITVVLATNLLYYSTMEPSMSHVYCFGLTAIFLYYCKVCYNKFSTLMAIKASVVFCLLLIIRPTNISSLVLVPFLAGDRNTFNAVLKNVFRLKTCSNIISCSIIVIGIQCLIWKIETGNYIYWSYRGEKFYFTASKYLYFLFSYRNGWFIYTPIMFIVLMGGFIILLRKSFYQFITFFCFFIIVVYLLSSWYAWYYGGFGMRAMVDYYAAFGFLLALCLTSLSKNSFIQIPALVILGLLIYVNIIQTRQYTNFILPNNYMTREKYWKIFLKTDSKYVNMFEHKPPLDIIFFNKYTYENDFENNTWGNNNSISDEYAYNNRHSAFVGDKINCSPILSIRAGDLPQHQKLYSYIQAGVYMPDLFNNARIVLSIQSKDGRVYSTDSVSLKPMVHYFSGWDQISETIAVPTINSNDDSIKIYFFATTGKTYIDDEKVLFGTMK